MSMRMLIDARHPEETRVAVVTGNRIEEFDFESAEHKQLKGNIYLAKVTRVEPSLQAAFVDYGGNRHGFLAFSEIHPDYYQIPVADRQTLIEHEAAEERAHAAAEERQVDAVVHEAFAFHAVADPQGPQCLGRAVLEHARADARQHVLLRAAFEHDAGDAALLQQQRQQRTSRSSADDRDLRLHERPF